MFIVLNCVQTVRDFDEQTIISVAAPCAGLKCEKSLEIGDHCAIFTDGRMGYGGWGVGVFSVINPRPTLVVTGTAEAVRRLRGSISVNFSLIQNSVDRPKPF